MWNVVPDWLITFLVQCASAVTAATVGVSVGRLIKFIDDRRGARRQRVKTDDLRKLEAKKLNEHIKLIGSFCNTVGAAIIGAAFIVPYIGNHTIPSQDAFWWIGVGLAFPITGHVALRFMKSES